MARFAVELFWYEFRFLDSHPTSSSVRRALLSIIFLIALFSSVLAQTAPPAGILPFSTQVSGAYDSFDMATGNVLVTIPVRSKMGKIPFAFSLIGNSRAWVSSSVWVTTTINQNPSGFQGYPGFLLQGYTVGNLGSRMVANATSFMTCGSDKDDGVTSELTVVDQYGAIHPMPSSMEVDTDGCIGTQATGVATDGSGYTLHLQTTKSVWEYDIYDRAGNHLSFTSPQNKYTLTDPDGATLVYSFTTSNGTISGTYADSLNTTALTTSGSSLSMSSATYTGGDGNSNDGVSVTYTNFTQKTVFGCSGVTELDSGVSLPTSVTIVGGGTISISYETTPGYSKGSGVTTGRIAQITYPSGGSVSYQYSGGNNGMNCTSQVVPTVTRTVNDNNGNNGAWTYVNLNSNTPSACTGPGPCNYTVTETTPKRPGQTSGDTITHYFSGEYETERIVSDASLGVLSTTVTCYNASFSSCSSLSTPPVLPITQTDVYSALGPSTSSLIETSFDSYGNVTEVKSYNGQAAGTAPSGSPVMDRRVYYGTISGSNCVALANANIHDKVCADEYFPSGGSSVDKLTESIRNANGHPTQTNYWVGGGQPSLSSYATYSTTNGTILTSTDVDGAVTTYHYDGSCNGMVITSTTLPTVNVAMSTSQTWDCNGGVVSTSTDVNGGVTTYTYNDPLYRLTSVLKANGGTNTATYSTGTSHPWHISTTWQIDSSHTLSSTAYLDGLGRAYDSLLTSDPYGSDEVDTVYDLLGNVYSVSNPHRSTSSPTDGITVNNSYDAIGRIHQMTLPHGDVIYRGYYKRSTAWYAENSSTPRFYQTDDLGRLTSVCEETSVTQANGATPVVPCNSDYAAGNYSGFVTSYTYDPLNRLTQVSQSGQVRQFFYDGLSRMTEEINPETGPKYYSYDTQNAGDLYQRTAGEPNHTGWSGSTTTYTHDLFHRLTNITYGDPYTNPAIFYWDVSTWMTGKQLGRMVRQDNAGSGGCTAPCAGEEYSYDIDGNIKEKASWTPSNWNTSSQISSYLYNYFDQQTSMTDPGGTTFTTSYDAAGRPTSLTSSLSDSTHPPTLYTVNNYNPLGEVTSATYGYTGSGMTSTAHTATFDNRGRLLTVNDAVTGGSPYSLTVSYLNGRFASANDSVNGNWSSFQYDDFGRLKSSWCGASCPDGTNAEGYNYTYDEFGNRWTQTLASGSGPGFQSSYNFDGNNHLTPTNCTSGAGNFCYDGAGNLEYDGLGGNWAHDAEGLVFAYETSSTTDTYTHDGLGQRVERVLNGTTYDYVFDNQGHESTKWSGGFAITDWVNQYFDGTRVSTYVNGSTAFSHNDQLLTPRAQTDPTGNTNGTAYTNDPWGEVVTNALTGDLGFTGDLLDNSDGNVFHTPFRQYSPIQGRWMAPDPAGLAAVDPTNPQTWNRYAYVTNNPTNYADPTGLYEYACAPGYYGGDCEGGGGGGGGIGGGGSLPSGNPPPLLGVGPFGGGGAFGCSSDFLPCGPIPSGNAGLPCDFGFCGPQIGFGVVGPETAALPLPYIPTTASLLSSLFGATLGVLLVQTGDGTPYDPRANLPESIQKLLKNCTPGTITSEPATGRAYQGGTSYVQEFNCSGGSAAVHWIVLNGNVVHGPHVRFPGGSF